MSVDAMKKPLISSSTISFLKGNVLNITDITRSNKLSEILNMYAGKETNEVFVIQNNKNRNAAGVLLDLEYYERLLKIEETIDQAIDDYMHRVAISRKDEKACLSLDKVIDGDDFDMDELLAALPDIELDGE